MKDYRVICIDMFQTLVNIESRTEYIWKSILEDDYSEELRRTFVQLMNKKIAHKFYKEECIKEEFRNLKTIFEDCFYDVFSEAKVSYDPEFATTVLIREHNNAHAYHDSIEFINRVSKKYPVCLVSDADTDMVKSLVKTFDFDNVFISEDIGEYKGNTNYKIFKEVINYYGIEPSRMIHIGDSSSDVIGAHRAGIDSCWLNRGNNDRWFDQVPNYEIQSLTQLYDILAI